MTDVKPKRHRLKTQLDVRRYLARIANSVEGGLIEPQTGGRLAYICNILLNAIQGAEVEQRLKALEEKLLILTHERESHQNGQLPGKSEET